MHVLKTWTLAAAMTLAAGHAGAVPIIAGQWYTFDTYADTTDSPWVDESLDTLSFDVTLSGPAALTVVDAGLSGGRYEVFANGQSLGATSLPGDAGDVSKDLDFDAALADARWSRGTFFLAAGTYAITGKAIAFGPDLLAETGGVMLTPVPEPETWALFGVGSLLVGVALRRQRSL